MPKTSLSELFLKIYNELDNFMRKSLKTNETAEHNYLLTLMASKNRIFGQYEHELRAFARLRNAIVHNIGGTVQIVAEPHQEVVEKYESIKNEVVYPRKALKIAVPGPVIFTTTLSSKIQDVMKIMIKNTYTHVPVIDKGKMIGIFSENTIMSYLIANPDAIITSDAMIEDFREFLVPEKHMSEYFEFVDRDTLLSQVEEIFNQGLKNQRRIAVVYITEHGKQEERLLGMLTAWDIAGTREKS